MRSYFVLGSIVASCLVSTSLAQDNPYTTLDLVDATNFCTFLPPADSQNRNIADTEYIANVFCMGNTPTAKSAGSIPEGLIQSAHFLATDNYVQVTGQIDPAKGNLNVTDEGGQYDIVMPKGAICTGYKHFVNLIEPAGHTFCLRCCHSKTDCNRGISEKGCSHIIPGDYSGPMDGTGAGNVGGGGASQQPSQPAASSPGASVSASASAGISVGVSAGASSGASSAAPSSLGASSAASSAASSSAPASSKADDSAAPVDASGSVTAQSVDSGAEALIPAAYTLAALLVTLGLLA